MVNNNHETLVFRLAQILVKLNQGERLDPQSLADEFRVNLRTIQRDLNERFAYLPLKKVDGRYLLEPSFLGKLSTRDIERFATLAGVKGLFPSLSDDFLRDIFDTRIQAALLVKGHHYEDLRGKEALFRQLEEAIIARRHVAIRYRKNDGTSNYRELAPYKLLNHKGIWYLVARDGTTLKTFTFTKIAELHVLDSQFPADSTVEEKLATEDGIWFREERVEIILKIASDVAGYFKRRKLIANQVIEKELEDGSLLVSTRVGHYNQVLPIVRYWIPSIRIVSPEALQVALERDLKAYVTIRSDDQESARKPTVSQNRSV